MQSKNAKIGEFILSRNYPSTVGGYALVHYFFESDFYSLSPVNQNKCVSQGSLYDGVPGYCNVNQVRIWYNYHKFKSVNIKKNSAPLDAVGLFFKSPLMSE